jgi:hypothetical protein
MCGPPLDPGPPQAHEVAPKSLGLAALVVPGVLHTIDLAFAGFDALVFASDRSVISARRVQKRSPPNPAGFPLVSVSEVDVQVAIARRRLGNLASGETCSKRISRDMETAAREGRDPKCPHCLAVHLSRRDCLMRRMPGTRPSPDDLRSTAQGHGT